MRQTIKQTCVVGGWVDAAKYDRPFGMLSNIY